MAMEDGGNRFIHRSSQYQYKSNHRTVDVDKRGLHTHYADYGLGSYVNL